MSCLHYSSDLDQPCWGWVVKDGLTHMSGALTGTAEIAGLPGACVQVVSHPIGG